MSKIDYTILDIDQERNIVCISGTIDGQPIGTLHEDGAYSGKHIKRMQVNNSDTKEAIVAEIEAWATNFARIKEAENASQQDVSSLIGKKQTIEAESVTEI